MKKILLLDDSTDYGIILSLQLKPYKYQVIHHETIEEALDALSTDGGFDYVFCDFYIGIQSAYDFIKAFNSVFEGRTAPLLVVLTNLPPDSPQLQVLHDEGYKIYQKPTRSEQVANLVQALEPSDQGRTQSVQSVQYSEPRT